MPIGDFNMTDDQTKAIGAGFLKWQAEHNPQPAPTTPAVKAVPDANASVAYPTTTPAPTTQKMIGPILGPESSRPTVPVSQPSPAPVVSHPAPTGPINGPFTSMFPNYGPSAQTTVPHTAPQQDGTLHLNVNGQAEPDVPVFKGTSFESGTDLAKQLGLDYKADPKTGEITIGGTKVMPTGYDKQGNAIVGVRAVANALGYQIGYDDKTKMVTVTGKSPSPYSNDLTQQVQQPQQIQQGNGYNSPIQGIYDSMPQMQPMTPWQMPDVSGFQNSMLPYQSFNPNIDNYYQQAHNQLDPQFNANNQKLMDKQNLDIQKSDESMNRRGIFSSGVAQAVEDDLRAKTTNALAAGFTAQMGQIEKVAQNLFNTAYKQFQDGNQFALKNNQDQINNMLKVEQQSFSQWAQTQKLDQSQYNYALKAWNDMAGKIMTDAQNNMKANQFQQTSDFNQYKFDHPSAAQQLPYQYQTANNAASNATSVANNAANNQTKEDIAALPYKQMTVYQQATTSEKAQMDAAVNYFKQQGININTAKLMESIRHNQSSEALTANGQANTAAHNSATETETNRHNVASEAHATQIATQNDLKTKNANLFNIWKATGKAPAGIDGVAEGTSFLNASSATKIDSKESFNQSASIKSQLDDKRVNDSKNIDKSKAKGFIDANKDILTDSDYRDLQAWADSTFKK